MTARSLAALVYVLDDRRKHGAQRVARTRRVVGCARRLADLERHRDRVTVTGPLHDRRRCGRGLRRSARRVRRRGRLHRRRLRGGCLRGPGAPRCALRRRRPVHRGRLRRGGRVQPHAAAGGPVEASARARRQRRHGRGAPRRHLRRARLQYDPATGRCPIVGVDSPGDPDVVWNGTPIHAALDGAPRARHVRRGDGGRRHGRRPRRRARLGATEPGRVWPSRVRSSGVQ